MPSPACTHFAGRWVPTALALITLASAPAAGTMPGDRLRGLISGKRVYLATPLGQLPLTYHADGRPDGNVTGITRLLRDSDSGNWWMSGNRMCQKWQHWYDAHVYCLRLRRRVATFSCGIAMTGKRGAGASRINLCARD